MTFRTSGRGRGDSAFRFSGFRVTRISGSLDSCRDTSPRLGVKLCTRCRVAELAVTRPSQLVCHPSHERSRRAGGNAVPLVRSFAQDPKQHRCFEILGPSRPRVSITTIVGQGKRFCPFQPVDRSSGLKAGRPASRYDSFGPHRDHRCCQERAIGRPPLEEGGRRPPAADSGSRPRRPTAV